MSQPTQRQLHLSKIALSLLGVLSLGGLLSSCASNEELESRMEQRNANYSDLQQRREIRQDARQGRTDAWYDRAMH